MGLLSTILGGPVTAVVNTVGGIVSRGQERRIAQDAVKGRIAEAKQKGETEIVVRDAEWESLSIKQQNESWKDEFLTVVITAPLVLILAGGIYQAFTGDERLMEGVIVGLNALTELGVDMGALMYAVVLAGVGLKVWRGR